MPRTKDITVPEYLRTKFKKVKDEFRANGQRLNLTSVFAVYVNDDREYCSFNELEARAYAQRSKRVFPENDVQMVEELVDMLICDARNRRIEPRSSRKPNPERVDLRTNSTTLFQLVSEGPQEDRVEDVALSQESAEAYRASHARTCPGEAPLKIVPLVVELQPTGTRPTA